MRQKDRDESCSESPSHRSKTPDAHFVFLWTQLADRLIGAIGPLCTALHLRWDAQWYALALKLQRMEKRARGRAIEAHKRMVMG